MGNLNIKQLATGGSVPQTSGIDTVPTMLSGGEFIMNAGAAQRIGPANLNAMNSGMPESTADSKDLNSKLIAKLDELIKTTKENKAVNVNVTSPNGKENSTSDQSSKSTSEKDTNLQTKIKAAVLTILRDEQRLGGSLRRGAL
jgi:hypothetical protein